MAREAAPEACTRALLAITQARQIGERTMATQHVRWTVVERRPQLRGDKVLSIGLQLIYPDRECELQISPSRAFSWRNA